MPALTARADRRLIRPDRRSERFVLVELTAPAAAARDDERPPVNLAFVVDRSGSMAGRDRSMDGNKLDLAKRAVVEAIGHLSERDRFSIVTYDDDVDLVCESSSATTRARRDAVDRLERVAPGGSTNLSGGWLRGCEEVARRLSENGVDRVLLLTDGLANVGIVDSAELTHHAAELRARGVSTTTFGIGRDFDEELLQSMADAGGGHAYYIAEAAQIRDLIASEVGEARQVVARDAELEVQAGEGVHVEALSPQPTETRGSRTIVRLGGLVSEQTMDVVLRVRFPYGELGRETAVHLRVTDRDGAFEAAGAAEARLTWTWADDRANDEQPRDEAVDRAVAAQFAARARQEAVRRNKAGDYEAAKDALRSTARRIRDYAGKDAVLRGLVGELQEEGERYAAPVAAAMLKEDYYASAYRARMRDASGKTRTQR
jgi:Ca-activated chloride channel family protein